MRHRKSGRKLNRNSSQRSALKKSLAISIIEHESIKTTLAKAKEIRGFLEPLVTLAKKNTVAAAIAAVTSQKETPTKSLASKSPPEAANNGAAITLDRISKDFIFLSRY